MQCDLPQIDSPEAAIAEINQRQTFSVIPTPREVIRRVMPGTPTTYRVPHKQSSSWFKEVYNGYMTAQSIGFAYYAGDVLKLFHSENLELYNSASMKDGDKPLDDSQHPRRIAIWLLGEYGGHQSNVINSFLDSFSKWANARFEEGKIVNHCRMTALFGVDVKQILEMTKHELLETSHGPEINETFIMLRWHTGRSFQSAIRKINVESNIHDIFCPMRSIQETVVRLSGVHDMPIPSICMKNIAMELKREQEFYHILHDVSEEFFNLLVGHPSITFSKEIIEKKASRILIPTGCVVRVCNKALGEKGLVDSSCFHGAILALRNEMKNVEEFLKLSDEEGVRPPVSLDEHKLGLHLCAVQAESMQLKNFVSLYGTFGISGKPIHSPGSWVWVARPAVRPLGPDLLNVFSLHPCSKSSILPIRKELIPAFQRFWAHTTNIYKLIADGEHSREHTKKRQKSPTSVRQLEVDDRDAAILAMMQLDMKSQRTTIGDAYAQISMFHNTTHITSNMLESMRAIGIRASLWQMFDHNQKALARLRNLEDSKQDGQDCFLKFAEVVLDTSLASKRIKFETSSEPLCLGAERVRRILKACSVKGGMHVTLDRGFGTIEEYGDTLQNILLTSTAVHHSNFDPKLSILINRPLVSLFQSKNDDSNWLHDIEKSIASSASKLLVSVANLSFALFMVIGTKTKDEVLIKTINLDGSISNGSLDDMCKVARPKVIVLQELTSSKVRIMGTTEIMSSEAEKLQVAQNTQVGVDNRI